MRDDSHLEFRWHILEHFISSLLFLKGDIILKYLVMNFG